MIKGVKTYLRPVDDDDLSFIGKWENNPEFWTVSDHPGPFNHDELVTFIQNSQNLKDQHQIRWVILNSEKNPVGAIVIFDFDPATRSAGIGIMIAEVMDRKLGYAHDALSAIINHYAHDDTLNVLRCLIYYDNVASLALFRKNKFVEIADRNFKGKTAKQFILDLKA